MKTDLIKTNQFSSSLTLSQNKTQEYLQKCKTFLALNRVKFTMSGIHSKIIRHAKCQENTTYIKEKNQSIAAGSEMAQIIDIVDKEK